MSKTDNTFKLNFKADIELTKLDFKLADYNIENPKDNWKGFQVERKGKTLIITVKAYRHKHTGPATFYKKSVDYDTNCMIHTAGGSNSPDELNFAVKGTLYINDERFDVCIGQGNHVATNNWHFCSPAIQAKDNNKGGVLYSPKQSATTQLYLDPSGNYSFNILCVRQLSGLHNNEFLLSFGNEKLDNFSFNVTDSKVTIGQPYDGVTTSIQNGKGQLIIKAGRSKSKVPAKWFAHEINKGSAIASFTGKQLPDELNFAIKGTLQFSLAGKQYTIKNVLIGQGSNQHIMNNWWFGGALMKGVNLPVLGGGLITLAIGIPPQAFLVKSILNTNEMSMQAIAINDHSKELEHLNLAIAKNQ